MKHKMTQKLVAYFAITLLIFALIIGISFSRMFRQSTLDQSRIDLELRAKTIANSVAVYLEDSNSNHGHMGMMRNRELNTYLESLEATTIGEVWVVDNEMQSIFKGHGHGSNIQLNELPTDSEQLIKDALNGKIVYGEGFSSLLNSESVTVGVPVYNRNQAIIGAVLLHSPIAGIDTVINHGYHVLAINIGVALVLSALVAYFLSNKFVRPLKRMNEVSKSLTNGEYDVKTDVDQNDEIGELAKSLDILSSHLGDAAREREKLDHMRNEFFADISHELKTPVTIIRGSLELMNDTDTQDITIINEHHESLLEEVVQLQKLIEDLLDFSKLNTTDFKLNKELVNLNDIVDNAIRSLRPLAMAKGINITYKNSGEPYPIYGDYARLRQMITIVLDNAIKFSLNGGKVEIVQDHGRLIIRDFGKGIAEDELENIFNRFYKDVGTDNKVGNGIGLAIAKQIADRHDILISVESKQHQYTKFEFEFPKYEH